MSKQFILFVFLTVLCESIYANAIHRFGLENGLSNNYVLDIKQDEKGIFWIATRFGLNRFDGIEFKTYLASDGNGLNANEINAVYTDTLNNQIWIATARRGINVFDCNTNMFDSYTHDSNNPHSLINDGTTDIVGAENGNLWIATYSEGIEFFDSQSKKFIHYNTSNVVGLVSNFAWEIADDKKGNLYIAHVSDGFSVLNWREKRAKNFKHIPNNPSSLPNNKVTSVFIDSYNNVWVGTDDGLALFNPSDESFTVFKNLESNNHSLSNNFVTNISETSDRQLAVGTALNGINFLDLKQLFFSRSVHDIKFTRIVAGNLINQLSHSFVKTVFTDSYGNIWIGTFGGGLNFIPKREEFFKTYSYNPFVGNNNSLTHKTIRGLTIDNDNLLWIVSDGGGIDIFKGNDKLKHFDSNNSNLSSNNIYASFLDSEGCIWLGFFDGKVSRYNPKYKSFDTVTGYDFKGEHINCFFEDRNKTIWIGSNCGLHSYSLINHSKASYNNRNSGIDNNMVLTVSQDNVGNLWIGTLFGEIIILNDKLEKLKAFLPNNNLYGINQIYRDGQGQMWVATGEKLFRYNTWDDENCISFGIEQGLTDNFISAIIEGKKNELWCSTNKGISRINLNNNTIENYNEHDGIPIGNFMPHVVAKSDDNIIYFGSDNGVCYFNQESEPFSHNIPPVTISSISVIEKKSNHTGVFFDLPFLDEIELNHKQNTFTITYNILDLSYDNKVEFSYSLEGLDNTWYHVKNTRQVTFRNLKHGKYIFHVKSRYKNKNWSNKMASLAIVINPPVWLTWWAKTIYFIFIGLLMFYIYRVYKNRLLLKNALYLEKQNHLYFQELNNERLQFYTNIAHELRTPLTLILGPLEDLTRDLDVKDKIKRKIISIHRSAERLLDLISQILEFRKTETFNRKLNVLKADLAHTVDEITLKYSELNRNPELVILSEMKGENFEIYFDPEIVTIILDNLISNAVKHTQAGEIRIKLEQVIINEINYTLISVQDTGRGIESQFLPFVFDRYYKVTDKEHVSGFGLGLAIVKSLIQLHQGEINVNSAPGKGTEFSIMLKSDNVYPDAVHIDIPQTENGKQDTFEKGKIILVVEDNPEIQLYVKETFEGDFEVLTANNGLEGRNIAFSTIPDIIISDIVMAVMNGIELSKAIKNDIRTSHIPIILLTAKDTIQDKTEGYSTGADSYITKPFSGGLLKARVTNLLESRDKLALHFKGSFNAATKRISTPFCDIDNEFLKKIIKFIEEQITESNINIGHIADHVFMSHSTLYRKVKVLTGLSTNDFIRKIRLQKAQHLLVTSDYNISEVMFMVGISSATYFRKSFKEEFGVSPSEYKKQQGKN
jgi:signal transduction histidine kinase/ligand-binding sensor domain-containing protein/DNA-binding response OmpR family regulator